MFFLRVRITKSRILCLICILAAVSLLSYLFCSAGKVVFPKGEEAADRKAYLYSLGYRVDSEDEVKTPIKIPTDFSEIYEEYNEKQIKAGFNLKDYKGRQATLYSYPLDDFGEGVYISLIVCDGRIIGGDVSSVSADGFVLPLQNCKSNLKYCKKTGD